MPNALDLPIFDKDFNLFHACVQEMNKHREYCQLQILLCHKYRHFVRVLLIYKKITHYRSLCLGEHFMNYGEAV